MKREFTVAIVGRPNVGKSALFNRMVSANASIVHKESGVTRDRLYGRVNWLDHEFTLVDTGGLDLVSEDSLVQAIKVQVEQALREADALVFVVDSRAGITGQDIEVAEVLRNTQKPLIVAANKCDVSSVDGKALEFYSLGSGEVFPVSALHGLGVGDLLDRLVEIKSGRNAGEVETAPAIEPSAGLTGEEFEDANMVAEPAQDQDQGSIRVAIVGKPNVGKSSLVNVLLGEGRMTVSPVPGTTVDAVDVPFTWDGVEYVLVDTAGLRRPKVIGERLEGLAVGRALEAVKRADVVILMLDGTSRPTAQDRRIAGYINRNGKASVIVVNKIDLGLWQDVTKQQYKAAALYECRPIDYSGVLFVSCATKKGIDAILPEVQKAYRQYSRRVETATLNQIVGEIIEFNRPPRQSKFFYATQVGQKPPRMVFFVRNADKLTDMYLRYLEAELRKRLGFEGTPIILEMRERQRSKKK